MEGSRKRGEVRIPRILVNSLKTAFDQNRAPRVRLDNLEARRRNRSENPYFQFSLLPLVAPQFAPASLSLSIFDDIADPFSRETPPRVDRSFARVMALFPSSPCEGRARFDRKFSSKRAKGADNAHTPPLLLFPVPEEKCCQYRGSRFRRNIGSRGPPALFLAPGDNSPPARTTYILTRRDSIYRNYQRIKARVSATDRRTVG